MGTDNWEEGDAYDHYMGRWSRPVAEAFVGWLDPAPGGRWVDVGCGTGALTSAIATAASPVELVGVDPSGGFLAGARRRLGGRARFVIGDAEALPLDFDHFDTSVSGLALNFVPHPSRAVREMVRVTRPGGTVAAYVWDYAEGMELIRIFWDVAATVDPSAAELDEGSRFPLCRPDALEALFERCGLDAVACTGMVVATPFVDFEDYWRPLLGGQGPIPSYVASLHPDTRHRLRTRLAETLAPDGDRIELSARAWAIRGTVRPVAAHVD